MSVYVCLTLLSIPNTCILFRAGHEHGKCNCWEISLNYQRRNERTNSTNSSFVRSFAHSLIHTHIYPKCLYRFRTRTTFTHTNLFRVIPKLQIVSKISWNLVKHWNNKNWNFHDTPRFGLFGYHWNTITVKSI